MALVFLLFSLVIFLSTATRSTAIKCYECNFNTNPACGDPGKLSQLDKDCSVLPGRDRCIKTVGPGAHVMRACSASSIPEGCTNNTLTGMQTCVCTADYCNMAFSTTTSTTNFFLTVISIALFLICL